jgi:predicted RNA binding protein YcfA (HicA-like mRNA interferase family)
VPKKIRELKAMLSRAGFAAAPGKGSHSKWTHPSVADVQVVIAGNDGSDAKPYLEAKVRAAI